MTIINETTQAIQIGNTWGFGGGADIAKFFVCLALCGFFIFALIWGVKNFDNELQSMLITFVIMIIITGLGALAEAHTKPIYKYTPQYEILIDDTVTAREFFDKYELIDRRGEIFVVVEKTDN